MEQALPYASAELIYKSKVSRLSAVKVSQLNYLGTVSI
jgi:hypothetical protein